MREIPGTRGGGSRGAQGACARARRRADPGSSEWALSRRGGVARVGRGPPPPWRGSGAFSELPRARRSGPCGAFWGDGPRRRWRVPGAGGVGVRLVGGVLGAPRPRPPPPSRRVGAGPAGLRAGHRSLRSPRAGVRRPGSQGRRQRLPACCLRTPARLGSLPAESGVRGALTLRGELRLPPAVGLAVPSWFGAGVVVVAGVCGWVRLSVRWVLKAALSQGFSERKLSPRTCAGTRRLRSTSAPSPGSGQCISPERGGVCLHQPGSRRSSFLP